MNRIIVALLVVAIVCGYAAYVWDNGADVVLAKPAAIPGQKPEAPDIPAMLRGEDGPKAVQIPAPPADVVVLGVGVNPNPGVYPAGWGPCVDNTFGPGGPYSWGCPLGTTKP